MTIETESDESLPPWVLEKQTGVRRSARRAREDSVPAPPQPKALPKPSKRNKKPARAPSTGEWEVQVKTGGQGRSKWGWLLSVSGMAPDKHQIRSEFGPGHYRLVESGGYSEEFIIAKVPAVSIVEAHDDPAPAESPDIEDVIKKAVASAVSQAMVTAMQSIKPLIASFQSKSSEPSEAINDLRSDLGQLAQLVRALAERPQAVPQPAQPSGPPWQMAIIEKVMTAGLSNMGIADDEEEEDEPDNTEKLINIGTTLLGAVMQNRAAQPSGPQPQPAIAHTHPQAPHVAAPPGASASVTTLPGMTPEIEAELRAYAAKIGYDYDAAITEAHERGASAQALLEQCRALIGPLE